MAKKQPHYSIPSWMTDVKEDAVKTNEWNELSKHIYEAVEQHLSQNHVAYFTDLSETEKNLLMERAARSLASADGGHVYENLQSKLSYLLDQSVNNRVAKKMLEDYPMDTKTDLVLDTTSEGIVTLLRKHPDQKHKLRVFFNQVIPQPIRFMAWQLFFANENYRKVFVDKLMTNPKLCLSQQDIEIQRNSDKILNSVPSLKEMRDSRGILNSIKGVLSYYHSTFKKKRNLSECEFLFSFPIVYTHYPPLPKNDSPTERSMAILIEIYQQFISTLPNAIIQTLNGAAENPDMDLLVKRVISILEEFDPNLLAFLKDLVKTSSSSSIQEVTFHTAVKSVCAPMMKCLFSGYLNMGPLMFVWDQYVISSDVPGFHDELIPTMAAIILMVLRDQLVSAHSIAELDICVKSQAIHIQTRQIQALVNKYFFKNLQTRLNTSSSRIGPIIDPTVGHLRPWEHWHQDIIPRRNVRPVKDAFDTDEKLQEEINRRILAERAAKDEIERLRRELLNLKSAKTGDNQILLPPLKTGPNHHAAPVSQHPVLDLLARMQASVIKVAEGSEANKKALDKATAEDLRLHKLDLRIAEREVFGHQLVQDEWENMSENDRAAKSQKMLTIVKNRIESRFRENGSTF